MLTAAITSKNNTALNESRNVPYCSEMSPILKTSKIQTVRGENTNYRSITQDRYPKIWPRWCQILPDESERVAHVAMLLRIPNVLLNIV